MATIKYIITTSIVTVEENDVLSYGIACKDGNVTMHEINDISVDKTIVSNAVKTFNTHKLLPTHFQDAVEDLVVELSLPEK